MTITLPTGHERLQAGDTLAVSGSPGALSRALARLTADPSADDLRDPA